MTMFSFGTGYCFGKRTDLALQPVAFFGTCQDFSLDIEQALVELLGQFKDPVDVAPSTRKITGKIKFARLQATTIGNMILGVAPVAASGIVITGPETHTPVATTFVVSNAAPFLEDLGLYYHATGVPLIPVASAPTVGQYVPGAVGVGSYTINVGDESVALDVFYTQTQTTQFEIDVGQQLMGVGPVVEVTFTNSYAVQGVAKAFTAQAPAARFSKMPFDFKNTGYMIPEADFTCFGNAAGSILKMALTE